MQILIKNQLCEELLKSNQSIKCKLLVAANQCDSQEALYNLVTYPEKKSVDQLSHVIGCNEPSETNPNPFANARNLYHNTTRQQARHYIIGFKNNPELVNTTTLPYIAYNIALFFMPEYQVIYSWHENPGTPNQYHIHLVVGTTNISNGNCLPRNEKFKRKFCNYVNTLRLGSHFLEMTLGSNYK